MKTIGCDKCSNQILKTLLRYKKKSDNSLSICDFNCNDVNIVYICFEEEKKTLEKINK